MANKLYEVLESRILLLDGGFGTMVQQYGFTEEDYRGERFRDWNVLLKGCNDLLAVTRPGAVREIHVKYRHHRDRLFQRQRRVAGRLRAGGIRL